MYGGGEGGGGDPVIQARENKTACKGRSCVDGEELTDMSN